jgi:two-component system, NarL family, nitrate/nitrite response regulator NarL
MRVTANEKTDRAKNGLGDGQDLTKPAVVRQTIGILIVDDHEVVRFGLRHLIEKHPHMKIVGEAATIADALTLASREQPEIIILDLRLGAEKAVDIIPELLRISEESRIIVLTSVQDEEELRRASRLGAMGVIAKDAPADMLIKAIDRVNAGELWLNRRLTAALVAELRRPGDDLHSSAEGKMIAQVTSREQEIISLIGEGLKNKQIADRLFISETTVRHHITSILGKLQVSDRLELLIFAYRNNLVAIKR